MSGGDTCRPRLGFCCWSRPATVESGDYGGGRNSESSGAWPLLMVTVTSNIFY